MLDIHITLSRLLFLHPQRRFRRGFLCSCSFLKTLAFAYDEIFQSGRQYKIDDENVRTPQGRINPSRVDQLFMSPRLFGNSSVLENDDLV
jgi:hypothetical protein